MRLSSGFGWKSGTKRQSAVAAGAAARRCRQRRAMPSALGFSPWSIQFSSASNSGG
jgi:hypothetical protein